MRPRMEASAGVGSIDVIAGRPRRTERFPGDPRPQQDRLPAPPKVPANEDRSGVEREAPITPAEAIVRGALPEGEVSKPVRGFLYYAYKGKPGSAKKVELVYSGPAGDAVIALR
ncbi:MAG: hypothetical protein HYZ37_06160 [Candidatus Solibacter usitatus]|nr:hypothetical protein [Candidatus Solibacter usitatus]